MTGVGLLIMWGGYLLFVYGAQMMKGHNLSFGEIALPSKRDTYMSTMQSTISSTGTTSLPGGQAEVQTALAQAQSDAAAACSAYGANSSQCKAAQQRVKDISSLTKK